MDPYTYFDKPREKKQTDTDADQTSSQGVVEIEKRIGMLIEDKINKAIRLIYSNLKLIHQIDNETFINTYISNKEEEIAQFNGNQRNHRFSLKIIESIEYAIAETEKQTPTLNENIEGLREKYIFSMSLGPIKELITELDKINPCIVEKMGQLTKD
jgi:hypothetical protein